MSDAVTIELIRALRTIVAALLVALPGSLAWWQSYRNGKAAEKMHEDTHAKIEGVEKSVNGILAARVAGAKSEGHAEGVLDERERATNGH